MDITFTTLESDISRLNKYGKVINKRIESINDLQYDVIISPANSFGELQGGIDMAYYINLGRNDLQEYIYDLIKTHYHGEILIGQYCIVNLQKMQQQKFGEIRYAKPQFLVLAPTMTVPLTVIGTRNAYYYMYAVLSCMDVLLDKTNMRTVLCPVPCTGVGEMPINMAVFQMETAFLARKKTGPIYEIYDYDEEKAMTYGVSQNSRIMYRMMTQS